MLQASGRGGTGRTCVPRRYLWASPVLVRVLVRRLFLYSLTRFACQGMYPGRVFGLAPKYALVPPLRIFPARMPAYSAVTSCLPTRLVTLKEILPSSYLASSIC